MPEYNEALYKYFNYCLNSIDNEYAKCEFVMRMNKLIALMPEETDKNAIVKFTQDYFIPRDEKSVDTSLAATRKVTMQSLIYGFAATWEKTNGNAPYCLTEYADLSNCKNLVMNSIFGAKKENVYPAGFGTAAYDSLVGNLPGQYNVKDNDGNVVDFSATPKSPQTFSVMNERVKAKKFDNGLKSRDESLLSTFSAKPPLEPDFNQTELLSVDLKLQEMQKIINPKKNFHYQSRYENEKLNVLKELNSIKFFLGRARNACFDLEEIEKPHSDHLEYRRQRYERERDEYIAMENEFKLLKQQYQAEEKQSLPKNVKNKINTPKKFKKKLLQSGLKRLNAKRKQFQKAEFEFNIRQSKKDNPSKAEENFQLGYSSLQHLMATCFDEKNGFEHRNVSLTALREEARNAYKALNEYVSRTSMWNPKNWAGEKRAKLSAAKRGMSALNAILATFDHLKDNGVRCRHYTLMADGTLQSDRDNTISLDNKPKAAVKRENKSDMPDVINTDSKDKAKEKTEAENKTETKTEDVKNLDKNNIVSKKTIENDKDDINKVPNEPAKTEVQVGVKPPQAAPTENTNQNTLANKTEKQTSVVYEKVKLQPAMAAPKKTASKDPFADLTTDQRKKMRTRNAETEFLKDYSYRVRKYSKVIANFENKLNSNDIQVLEELKNNTDLKSNEVKRYLNYRIGKLREFNNVVDKAVENMQNRKVEEAKATKGNGEELTMVENVVQSEMQHTTNGCWSVALSTLLKHRGVDLDQSVIRAYRPDTNVFVGDTSAINHDTSNEISTYTDLIQAVLPNTSVNEAFYSNYSVDKLWSDLEKQKEIAKATAKMKETIQYAMKEANGPVAILVGRHYRTIYGFKEGLIDDTVYLNDPMEKDAKPVSLYKLATESISVEEKVKNGIKTYSNSCKFTVNWLKDLKNEKGEVQYSQNVKQCNATYNQNGELIYAGQKVGNYPPHTRLFPEGKAIIEDVGISTYLPNKLKDIQLKKEKKQAEVNVQKANVDTNVKVQPNADEIKVENPENKTDEIKKEGTEQKLTKTSTINESKVMTNFIELDKERLSESKKIKRTLTTGNTSKKSVKSAATNKSSEPKAEKKEKVSGATKKQ